MEIQKYSPKWLLEKIESTPYKARKLMYIVEFQQELQKEAINYNQCCMGESEQLFCDCEIPKPTDPYDVVDKHICRDCKQIIAK